LTGEPDAGVSWVMPARGGGEEARDLRAEVPFPVCWGLHQLLEK
jgi:hypothetical protein